MKPQCLSVETPCQAVTIVPYRVHSINLRYFSFQEIPSWVTNCYHILMLNASWRLPWEHWLALLVVCILFGHIQLQRPQWQKHLPYFPSSTWKQVLREVDYNLFQALVFPPGFLIGIQGLKSHLNLQPPASSHSKYCHSHTQTGRQKTPHISSCSNMYTSGWQNAKNCSPLQQILKAMVWQNFSVTTSQLLPVLYLPLVIQTK